jgi:hypothetical protein
MRELFKGGERKLNNGEGKQMLCILTCKISLSELVQHLHLRILPIRTFFQDVCGGCFNVRADHNLDTTHESNQHAIGSLGPSSIFHRQPIATVINGGMDLP